MSARHNAARQRRTFIARVARTMHREHGQVSPSEITHVAAACGWRTSNTEVRHVLTRLRLHR